MPTAIEKQEVTLAEAMRLTGYTKQNLQKLIDAGHLQRSERARFRLVDLFGGVMAHLRERRRTKSQSAAAERLLQARALEVEQRTAIRAGKLMETEEHFALMDLILGRLRATIESIPAQMSRDKQERRKAEEIVRAAFERCSHDLSRLVDETDSGDEEEGDE